MAGSRKAFWDAMVRFDRRKLAPVMAARNAIGMAIPLAAGILFGDAAGGALAATGALNVAFSDGYDPYVQRGRRMLAAAIFVSLAVFAGRYFGHDHALAISLEAACALLAGLMAATGQAAADMSGMTLVVLIVFSASPAPLGRAATSGLLALAGGAVQTALSLAMWPIHRYGPESRALAALYAELARSAAESTPASESPPATEPVVIARQALAGLAGDRSVDAERYAALFSQAERIRLGLLTLHRLRTRVARDAGGEAEARFLEEWLRIASRTLDSIARSLRDRTTVAKREPEFPELPQWPESQDPALAAMRRDMSWQLEAIAGQVRSALDLTGHVSRAGAEAFARREAEKPWGLRVAGALATLQANLTFQSAACRHGIRLAVCVTLADFLARSMGWQRGYWAAMTVAIVLKPDFTATYTRGVQRLAGTFAGLGVATALVHLLSPSQGVQAALITSFFFAMRWAGPANYGMLVTALSGLVVFLFALGGVPAAEVIAARAVNTVAGGVIALTAYGVWPTWEHTRIAESLAALFDGYRGYLQAVCDAFLRPGLEQSEEFAERISRARQAGRLARTNLEAAAARLSAEPGVDPARATAIGIILANSHRLIHAAMALEAGLFTSRPVQPRDAFRDFANGVDATLYFLSAYLRGSSAEPGDLPDLRAVHSRLIHSGDSRVDRYALVNIETDRITNSLNSLALETLHWLGSSP